MTLKYETELIKEIVVLKGHHTPLIHNESECIEKWIDEVKGAYPKLNDYQSEWLNYIVESPLGEFPYVSLTDVTTATVDNVVPYAYKTAILKGSTKYHDIDTGEFLETFEEGRNLELVSVKMPVLTTTNADDTKTNILTVNEDVVLRGIGDVKDELDCLTGEVVTRIKELNLKEITNWWMYTNSEINETVSFYCNVSTFMKKYTSNPNSLLCNSLPVAVGDTVVSSGYECIGIGGAFLKIRIAKSKLSEISANGLINYLNQNDIIIVGYSASESIKTVDLSVHDQDDKVLTIIKPIEGTMHLSTSSDTVIPTFSGEIPVEAITQNLASFIGE